MAKITVFTNEDAVTHALNSAEWRSARRSNPDLKDCELTQVAVKRDAEKGIGDTHTVSLSYAAKGAMLTVCHVDVTVETLKVQIGGITASRLGKPTIGKVGCAH